MKIPWLVAFMAMGAGSQGPAGDGPPRLLWPGMGLADFRTACPGVVPDEIPFTRQLERAGRFKDLEGRWRFVFEAGVLLQVEFSAEGQGVFTLGDDGSKARLAEQHALYVKELGSVAGLLEEALESPPTVSDPLPVPNAALSDLDSRKTIYSGRWELGGLRVALTLRLQGTTGFATDNSDAAPLRHVLDLEFTGRGTTGSIPGQRWYPGISAAAFAKLEPALLPKGLTVKGQWGRQAVVQGVEGQWTYSFDGGELDWVTFSRYWREPGQINAKNFAKGLAAARGLIRAYTKQLGKPQAFSEKNTRFRDPAKDHHWGYDVIEARWVTPQGKLKVSFDFGGGKGQYYLLLKLGLFRKDHPFFD